MFSTVKNDTPNSVLVLGGFLKHIETPSNFSIRMLVYFSNVRRRDPSIIL